MLKELPEKAYGAVTILFNALLRLGHVPGIWKVAQIILIQKPGKDPVEVTSYRPISLLPELWKLFERLLLEGMRPMLQEENVIPKHQFGFRERHSTIEQVHRVVRTISTSLEEKKYCSAVFLNVSQAFDKM